MATISAEFQFSQSSIQDYLDCNRRFELRHMLSVRYPAVEAAPARERERRARQGELFHKMAHQYILGAPESALSELDMDIELAGWWRRFLDSDVLGLLPAGRYPEATLATLVGGYRLVAKYDLVAIDPGNRTIIIDWKTSSRRPSETSLRARAQTLVYPFVLAHAGSRLNGGQAIAADQIQMMYWFPEFPDDPIVFEYSSEQLHEDAATIQSLIHEIKASETFPLTDNTERCKFCQFRSLCERGVEAGPVDAVDMDNLDETVAGFDFDQIAEIEF